ncbi:hypothetical protein I79_000298 [Cricetulus griseus]|uniref:Uncharacterized protein n=1 Tax=Cricetulus griseus TaxID=10029 RepID=G3GRP3_CRIGR|nr:hypothetical protein I79_000298 [Cricetulus griseus]
MQAGSVTVASVSVSPYEPSLVDPVGCIAVVSSSLQSSSPSSTGFPDLHLMFGCGSLNQALPILMTNLY